MFAIDYISNNDCGQNEVNMPLKSSNKALNLALLFMWDILDLCAVLTFRQMQFRF